MTGGGGTSRLALSGGRRAVASCTAACLALSLAACLGPAPRRTGPLVSAPAARAAVERAAALRLRSVGVTTAERAGGLVAEYRSGRGGAHVSLGVFATAADAEREVTSIAGLTESGPTPARLRFANVVVVYLAADGSRHGAAAIQGALGAL